jgi:speckle-type POZ protein
MVEASLVPPARLAAKETVGEKALRALQTDLGKLLEDPARADVTFAVGGQRISAHRIILAARSEHFKARFEWEQGEVAIGEEVSAGAFRVLLRYLYTQELPATEDGGEGLAAGEMAKAADYFQAEELYEHCVEQFKGGLRVGNVVERLVYAHDHQLEALEAAAMAFIEENARAFHREAMATLSLLSQHPHHLLLAVTGLLMAGVDPGAPGGAGAGGGVGAAGGAADA